MSKTGLLLCSLYAVVVGGCVAFAFMGSVDPKSSYVFLQVPIALQSALLALVGLAPLVEGISWPAAYVLLTGPVFAFLYLVGMLIDRPRPNPSPKRTA